MWLACASATGYVPDNALIGIRYYDDKRWVDVARTVMWQLLRYRVASDGRFRRLLARNARLVLSHY